MGNEVGIVTLLLDVFDGWPRFNLECSPLEHWNWKFSRDHINGKVIAISEYEGRIVGVSHAMPVDVKIGERTVSCYQASDLAIDSKFRRRGLFPKMSEIKTRLHINYNSKLNYGVTGNPRVIESSIKAGLLAFPKQIISLVWIKDVDLHIEKSEMKNSLLIKSGIRVLKTFRRLSRANEPNRMGFSIVDVNWFDERFSSFWNKIKYEYDFIVERIPEYLNLRYCDPRGGNYFSIGLEENGLILGYIVMRINSYNVDYSEGYIVDLLTFSDRLDAAEALINEAMSFFEGNYVNVVRYLVVSRHPYEGILKRYGFLDSKLSLRVNLHPLDVGSEWGVFMKAPPNRLHFQYGDTDWI